MPPLEIIARVSWEEENINFINLIFQNFSYFLSYFLGILFLLDFFLGGVLNILLFLFFFFFRHAFNCSLVFILFLFLLFVYSPPHLSRFLSLSSWTPCVRLFENISKKLTSIMRNDFCKHKSKRLRATFRLKINFIYEWFHDYKLC